MKIKGVIEDLKIKKCFKKRKRKEEKINIKKNDRKNGKDISRTFSVVVGSVRSVHFRIVPWSGLYCSRSIGPFLCNGY